MSGSRETGNRTSDRVKPRASTASHSAFYLPTPDASFSERISLALNSKVSSNHIPRHSASLCADSSLSVTSVRGLRNKIVMVRVREMKTIITWVQLHSKKKYLH